MLQEQSWRYDALGHLTETGTGGWPGNGDKTGNAAYAAQSRQHHDALGRLLWSADVRGSFTQHRYDTESRLLQSGRYGGRADGGSRLMAQVQTYQPGAPEQPPSAADKAGTETAPQARQFYDDFGRSVATLSPDSGLSIRGYDATDRLVSGRDALGQQARYEYDLRGRILRQTITQLPQDGARPRTTTTRWRYQGPRLVALEHPEQSEACEYNDRACACASASPAMKKAVQTVKAGRAASTTPSTTNTTATADSPPPAFPTAAGCTTCATAMARSPACSGSACALPGCAGSARRKPLPPDSSATWWDCAAGRQATASRPAISAAAKACWRASSTARPARTTHALPLAHPMTGCWVPGPPTLQSNC